MASPTDGPGSEFYEPERIRLLAELNDALDDDSNVLPTAWACLWLSDIDKLRKIVQLAQENSIFVVGFFWLD